MRTTAYDAEAAGSTSGDVLEVNAWRGGSLLAASLDVTAWALGWDAGRQVQGQATFTVADPDGALTPWGLSDALAPGGSRLQVTWVSGLSGVRIPLGWWRIRKADTAESWRLVPTRTPTGSVGAVAHTNLVVNPDAETYGAVATHRTNWATHATAKAYLTGNTANLGWTSGRWFGSAGAGTYTLVAGASDGPAPNITSYARKTWTTAQVSPGGAGDTGFQTSNWTGFVAGSVYVISGYIRSSIARTSVGWDVTFFDATGALQRANYATGALVANTWTRFSIAATAPGAGATFLQANLDTDGAQTIPVGTTTDVAGLLVEQITNTAVGTVQRTNLHPNPSVHRNTTNWGTQAGGATWTVTRETAAGATTGALPFGASHPWFKMTCTATNTTSPVGLNTTGQTVANGAAVVTAGQAYSFALYHVSSVSAATTVRIEIVWWDAAGAQIGSAVGGTFVANTANTWQRLTLNNQVAPAGAVSVRVSVRQSSGVGAFPVGGYIGATAVQVEQGTTLPQYWDGFTMGSPTAEYAWSGAFGSSASVLRAVPAAAPPGPYFDGATPAAGDFTYAWNGAADASVSLQRAPAINGVSNFNGTLASRWSSVTEHDTGARSWACLPLVTNNVVGFIWNAPTTVLAGQWVTATLRVKAPAGTSLSLSLRTSGGAGAGGVVVNCTGAWQDVTATAQAATDGALVGAQITNRPPYPSVPFYVDRTVMVVESAPYTGPYFDGRTPDTNTTIYAWTGAADASTSTQAPRVVTYASGAVLRLPGGGQVEVSADEETATAILNRLDAEVATSPTVLAEVTRLLRDVCPVVVHGAVVDGNVPAALVYGDSRMDAVEDLLTVIRSTHRMNGDGALEVVPDAGVGPVWALAGGDEGVLVGLERALSDESIYNAVVSSNETETGLPIVGRAYLDYGPLAWGGPFGKVPLFRQAIGTTTPAMVADARTTLANRQASGEVDLAVSCLAHPGVQPHDRVTILAPTRAGDAPVTGRVVGMSLRSADATPAKSMGLTVRVSTDALEAIAARVRRG